MYVVTPSLNKSFKFQSDWPYSNSQIYLLKSIVSDIKNDDSKTYKETKNGYIFTTKVNYPNNKKLVKQQVKFDKKLNLQEVKIYNDEQVPMMTLKVTDVDKSPPFGKSYFSVNKALKSSKVETKEEKILVIDRKKKNHIGKNSNFWYK